MAHELFRDEPGELALYVICRGRKAFLDDLELRVWAEGASGDGPVG